MLAGDQTRRSPNPVPHKGKYRPGAWETFIWEIAAGVSAGAVGRGPQTDRPTADRAAGSSVVAGCAVGVWKGQG